jgi:putative glutamine amidotransferase
VTYRPLVGVVTYALDARRVARWPEGGYGVPRPYVEALRRAGARTLLLAPGETGDPAELLEPFDGLLLAGGGDVEASRYGAESDPAHTYGVDAQRDELEIALLRAADEASMPTLCICRGMQVMNVAFGGTLHQHLPDKPELIPHGLPVDDTNAIHTVEPIAGTRLSATTKVATLTCSSHHHQGVDLLGEGLTVSGRSPDGLVEAIERGLLDMNAPDAGWMLGVQWHPEDTAGTDPTQRSLFEGLVVLANWRGRRAKPGETQGRGRAYRIADPDLAWATAFERESAAIAAALPPALVVRVEHIGSTSVPGLPAKPVIDIALALTSLIPREAYREPLCSLGYIHQLDPWNDDHEYFSREEAGVDAFHVHVCLADAAFETRHLAFRDWLRTHPDDAGAYAEVKRSLAAAHPRDIVSYVEGKSDFIASIESRAMSSEAASQGPGRKD